MLEYNKDFKGIVLGANPGAYTYTLRNDGRFAGVGVDIDGKSQGGTRTLTGFYAQRDNGYMYQTTDGDWVLGSEWYDTNKRSNVSTPSLSDTNALVQGVVENNKRIITNNLICARFRKHLSSSDLKKVCQLQQNLSERNTALKNSNFVSSVQESAPKGVSAYSTHLSQLLSDYSAGKIGSISVSTIVIAVVLVAGVAAAAYFSWRKVFEQSALDVKYSDELLAKLRSKLTEEEYNQLYKETQGMIAKSYFKGSIGGFSTIVKYALIAAGGYFGYKYIKNHLSKEYE